MDLPSLPLEAYDGGGMNVSRPLSALHPPPLGLVAELLAIIALWWDEGYVVRWLSGWMVGWLGGWVVGWLDGWMVGCLEGWGVGGLEGWRVEC